MKWTTWCRKAKLGKDKENELTQILTGLRNQFLLLCQEPTEEGSTPIRKLAQFIFHEKPAPDAISQYLVQLLETTRVGKQSILEKFTELEQEARSLLEFAMQEIPVTTRLVPLPDSLLDIDIGFDPFSDSLEKLVNSAAPPPGFFCKSPFEYAHVQENGDVYPCCPSKFGKVIGNLEKQELGEIWNSPEAEDVRNSILDGSYRHCNAQACEYLRNALDKQEALSPPALIAWTRNEQLINPLKTPKIINFGSDRTCNLACGYCRKSMYKLTQEGREKIQRIDTNAFKNLSDDTERIVLLGEGDPFASPIYLEKLRNYPWSRHPRLRIKIQTNGLLLTSDMWNSIRHSHCVIDWINVSIDAATPSTYAINRGGDFSRLKRNLNFIANLRALNKIRRFCISFLVQANNFTEIPAFARLGLQLGCDLIEFQRLENWGTYTEKEYRERAVHEAWHPDNEALLHVLEDPILQKEQMWLLKLGPNLKQSDEVCIMSWDDCNDDFSK